MSREPIRYCLTEVDIRYILNEVLGSWWVIWPRNMRKKAQDAFIKLADSMCSNGG